MVYEKELAEAGFDESYGFGLSRLIEACGEEFYSIVRMGSAGFKAFSTVDDDNTIASATEPTPDIAVAKLWLALNPKPL